MTGTDGWTVVHVPTGLSLSDEAFRVHIEAQIWVRKHNTAGRITPHELRAAVNVSDPEPAAQELTRAKLWRQTETGWVIVARSSTTAAAMTAAGVHPTAMRLARAIAKLREQGTDDR